MIDLTIKALRDVGVSCTPIGKTGIQACDMKIWITRAEQHGFKLRRECGWYGDRWMEGYGTQAEMVVDHLNQAQARAYVDLKDYSGWYKRAHALELRTTVAALIQMTQLIYDELHELTGQVPELSAGTGHALLKVDRSALTEDDEWTLVMKVAQAIVKKHQTNLVASIGPVGVLGSNTVSITIMPTSTRITEMLKDGMTGVAILKHVTDQVKVIQTV